MKKRSLAIFRMYLFSTAFLTSFCCASTKPNFILINVDDLGYGDLSCYGSKVINTPHIDKMAKEGRMFMDFSNVSSVCTPSRAGLMTGAFPKRIGMHQGVIFPHDKKGLHPNEITIADYLKMLGYTTACVGKWHLGHSPGLLPTKQGFDYYWGIPFSNDMNHWDYKKKKVVQTFDNQRQQWKNQETTLSWWNTPLMENERVIERPVDQRTITRRYTDKTIKLIKKAQEEEQPFFIYLAHSMPHVPIYVPQELWQKDFSKAYKIVCEHIDAEVGRIVDYVKSSSVANNTYILFTSDNGPATRQTGSAKPLSGKKFSGFEGGSRVPFIVWAPGKVPANTVSHAMLRTIDLLPTFVSLAGGDVDQHKKIDGLDVSAVLHGDDRSPVNEMIYYNHKGKLVGYRLDNFKVVNALAIFKKEREPFEGYALYDLSKDVAEQNNLASKHEDKLNQMVKKMQQLDAQLTNEMRPSWSTK